MTVDEAEAETEAAGMDGGDWLWTTGRTKSVARATTAPRRGGREAKTWARVARACVLSEDGKYHTRASVLPHLFLVRLFTIDGSTPAQRILSSTAPLSGLPARFRVS
jgi:hypothetical protein